MPRSDNAPRVYVTNYAGHDLSDAERYTSLPLVLVTEGYVPFSDQTAYAMAQKLRGFTEHDYLVLSGSSALAALAVAILKETNKIRSINVLVYKAAHNQYTAHRINGKIHLPESS